MPSWYDLMFNSQVENVPMHAIKHFICLKKPESSLQILIKNLEFPFILKFKMTAIDIRFNNGF